MTLSASEIGERRQAAHPNGTRRFFEDPNTEDRIGAAGELAFGKLVGVDVDARTLPSGDGGVDFVVSWYVTIDVKTARVPAYLLVKEADIDRPVDIYVLARYIDDETVEFLGWQTRSVMKRQPVRDFGYGIRSHYMAQEHLRPMSELIGRIKK